MQVSKITILPIFKLAAIAFCIAVTAFTLSHFALLIQHLIVIKYNWQFELFMITGMMLFQFPLIYKKPNSLKLDYYFNLLMISFIGAVLLWPLLRINLVYQINDMVNLAYFFAIVLVLFFVHKRVVATLSLPEMLSYTWVFYRFIVLLFILLK
ncbi:MAG: hypothetical protein JWR61_198 [Ferruginibacter sp.]|uniref:hypothetical protein n=1 Tax=Ferruginibacter sp. TaxID=1940288 RepID=UPI00265917EF|nr:hypothetical protein [Ferruginibacter sp.]MDB5275243.1 hypothetical protein [Ferruginibacter sp.]